MISPKPVADSNETFVRLQQPTMSGTPEKPDADLIKDESGGETPATAGFSDYRVINDPAMGIGS